MPGENVFDFSTYLKLDQITNLQEPVSDKVGKPAHDELMYIITHQCYELWFKLIVHELDSAIQILNQDYVPEKCISTACSRLNRVVEILDLTTQQFRIIETMTPLDYLDFRGLLASASGFQSYFFRLVENRIGLDPSKRLLYGNHTYQDSFHDEKKQNVLQSEKSPSLFSAIDKWLSRTPFVELPDFHFLQALEGAVANLQQSELYALANKVSTPPKQSKPFPSEAEYQELVNSGTKRLSWRATQAALFISLYRDEPILTHPFKLIQLAIDIDERLAIWRNRHALVVHKMLGRRPGTAGSTGYEYLRATTDAHRVFLDLFDIATLLVPRSSLPKLPESLTKRLGSCTEETSSAK